MPRTSRAVAQRLASQAKSKKRRAPRPDMPAPEGGTPSPEATASVSPTVEQILDEVVPSGAGSRAAASPVATARTAAPAGSPVAAAPRRTLGTGTRTGPGRAPAHRAAAPRRRYSEYAAEYAYVWADLHRIVIVAGVLVLLMVALWFALE
ncbi:MAG: hypothetical protein IT305_14425 [Chloroflexi bacterium]|nr:hypothetical protein [Chloroflexota bacterium]